MRLGARFVYDARANTLQNEKNGVRVDFFQSGHTTSESSVFDGVVICAGVESRRLAAQVGDRVNVYPVKGYSITINLPDETSQKAAPWVSMLDDDAKLVTSRFGDTRLRIAGTAEFNGANLDIRDDRIRPMVGWCRRYFPDVDTEHVVPWAGLRPMMPNMMPRIGAGKLPGIYYNTGHCLLYTSPSPRD